MALAKSPKGMRGNKKVRRHRLRSSCGRKRNFILLKLVLITAVQDIIKDEDEGRIMQCLISHKEQMDSKKCAAGVAHFQLVCLSLTSSFCLRPARLAFSAMSSVLNFSLRADFFATFNLGKRKNVSLH